MDHPSTTDRIRDQQLDKAVGTASGGPRSSRPQPTNFEAYIFLEGSNAFDLEWDDGVFVSRTRPIPSKRRIQKTRLPALTSRSFTGNSIVSTTI